MGAVRDPQHLKKSRKYQLVFTLKYSLSEKRIIRETHSKMQPIRLTALRLGMCVLTVSEVTRYQE